jgi:phosphoribosyl 1,2-cyclic phosphate phosphodiesterase
VVKVDFGPDTYSQIHREGRDLNLLTTLVFTHEHDDHFTPAELQYRKRMFVAGQQPAPLRVYGNENVIGVLTDTYPEPDAIAATFEKPLKPFVPVATADGTEILPVPAVHIPGALLLRISRNGKSLLYGHDSGPFADDAVDALGAAGPLDVALFDCTYGVVERPYGLHMGVKGVVETVERLRTAGTVDSRTRLIATHISHNSGLLHDQLAEKLARHGIELAYDGMVIDA